MKINKIEIDNFGKFKNYEIDFSNGFQTVFGKNEDGKTTLMSFIELMFYSKTTSSKDISKNPRAKYSPWDGSKMSGAIEFERNGEKFRLEKNFVESGFRDKTKVIDLISGEEVKLDASVEVGKVFFGLNLESFRRSCFIKQLGAFDAVSGNDDVAEMLLSGLAETGSEDYSSAEVIGRLEKAKFALISKNKKGGALSAAEERLDELKIELEGVIKKLRNQEEITAKYSRLIELEKEAKALGRRLESLEKLAQKEKLNELFALSLSREEAEKSILKFDLPSENREDFLTENHRLLTDYKESALSLETLKSSLSGENPVAITQEEKNAVDLLVSKKSKLSEISRFVDGELSENNFKLSVTAKKVSELSENLLKIQKKLDELKPQTLEFEAAEKRLFENENSLSVLGERLKDKEFLWAKQLEIEKEALENRQKAKKTTPNLPLLLLGLAVIIVAAILGFVTSPAIFAGIPVGLVFLIISFLNRDKSNKQQTAEEAPSQVKESIAAEKAELVRSAEALKKSVADDRGILEGFSEHKSILENLEETISELKINLGSEKSILNSLDVGFSEKLERLSSLLNDADITAALQEWDKIHLISELKALISAQLSKIEGQLSSFLASKSAVDFEDFSRKFAAYQGNKSASENAIRLDNRVEELSEKFRQNLIFGDDELTFELAKERFFELEQAIKSSEKLKSDIRQSAHMLGLENYSTEHIKELLDRLSRLAKEFESEGESYESLKSRYDELSEINISEQLRELAGQIQIPERGQETIENEIFELSEKVSEMREYYSGVTLALEMMTAANDELRESFGPRLNQKTGEILSRITGSKYSDVLINKAYQVRVKNGTSFKEHNFFSSGTIDQVYLSLRLAIAELISQNNVKAPLFLDDVLAQYDTERLNFALEFLNEYSKQSGSQIILFTCHNYIENAAERLGVSGKNLI